MQDVLSFEVLTLKELGAIASEARVPRWSRLKKAELIDKLLAAGIVPPTVAEIAARRQVEREERLAQDAPLAPPTFDASERPLQTPAIAETTPESANVDADADADAPIPATKTNKIKETFFTDSPIPAATPDAPFDASSSSAPADAESPASSEESAPAPDAAPVPPPAPGVLSFKEKMRARKILGSPTDENDRLVLSVCDPFWLRACWEATPRRVERIRSAMGQSWHTADPTLRLYRVDREPHGATRREFVADFPVRGGVNSCYVPVDDPPQSFVVELGYLARDKRFFTLISSAVVETPQRYVHDAFGRPEDNGLGFPTNFDAFVPQRRAPRPRFSPTPSEPTFSPGALNGSERRNADAFRSSSDLRVAVDCELVVKVQATPGARVRVKEESIRLKEDGTFSIRYRLPERRHVFPVVATSPDGSETRTVVLAVDRNTKTLDPVFRDEETEE
ncbi:MAG: DUF4912 domain-containing protein [Thermoguttaceae bacterium]|nr:DUF4912 domain-containing protein [Thermoguttaceae bacterium]MBR4103098.1 DUF4912 domain-containing protein [Thermoguttaceae bacterium]